MLSSTFSEPKSEGCRPFLFRPFHVFDCRDIIQSSKGLSLPGPPSLLPCTLLINRQEEQTNQWSVYIVLKVCFDFPHDVLDSPHGEHIAFTTDYTFILALQFD